MKIGQYNGVVSSWALAILLGLCLLQGVQGAERKSVSELQLVRVGDDCVSASTVFNQRLTLQQMRQSSHLDSRFIYEFITDYGERQRIGIGIFGERRELARSDDVNDLGRGAFYSDGVISVRVIRGRRRLKIIHPPPAACDDGYVESTEFFDAMTIVMVNGKTFSIPGTLMRQDCTTP